MACKLTIFVLPFSLHWFFDNKRTFKGVYSQILQKIIIWTKLEFKGDIAYLTWNTIVTAERLLPEEPRGTYGQNVVNVILTVSWFGSAKVNHNGE